MYEALLGPAWLELPEVVRAIHLPGVFGGRFDVSRGRSPLARLAARLCRFPPAGRDVAVRLTIAPEAGRWTWQRRFGDVVVVTWQRTHQGRLREGFGPILCDFELVPRADGLDFVQRAAWLQLGEREIRMPAWLAPRVGATVRARSEIARIAIEIRAPLCGLVLRYAGEVSP